MAELIPCPFCGASAEILEDTYPNGDKRIEPYAWHDEKCPLNNVLWCFDVDEDEWTAESIAEVWNRRAES